MKTNTRPPISIFDILHAAVDKGIEIPEDVDRWWFKETAIEESPKCKECKFWHTQPNCVKCQ